MAKHLILNTNRGRFRVNEQGLLTNYVNKEFSGGWVFKGLIHKKRTNDRIMFKELTPEQIKELRADMLYKNGNPQWTVIDIDHGTQRVWSGGRNDYGVISVYYEDVQE